MGNALRSHWESTDLFGEADVLSPTKKKDTNAQTPNVAVATWNFQDIRNWLARVNLEEFSTAFQSKRINGTQLLGFQSYNQIDEKFKHYPTAKKKILWKNIEKLKKEYPCLIKLPPKILENESKEMKVAQINVLMKLSKLRGFDKLPEEDRIQKARNLFIADKMLTSYLSESYIGTYNVIDRLYMNNGIVDDSNDTSVDEINQSKEEEEEAINEPSSVQLDDDIIAEDTHVSSALMEESLQQESNEIILTSNEEETLPPSPIEEDTLISSIANGKEISKSQYLDENKTNTVDLQQLSTEINENINPLYNISQKFLKVKLVIVEIHQNNRDRFFRHTLSPIMDKFRLAPTFGIFHSAIIVGPFYLEFNDSGLCIPRKCCSKAAILAADMSSDITGPHISVALDRLSKIICHWNAHITYSSKKNNCQTFVDELCKGLGIDIAKQTESSAGLGHFFNELRTYGKCDLKYVISKELYEVCPWVKEKYGKSITFNSHQELDQFISKVNKTTSYTYFQFTKQGSDDWILLKSFDRAFWLRHFQNNTVGQFIPHSCPFGNPEETGSMRSNWFSS